jgi:hypothetical protein
MLALLHIFLRLRGLRRNLQLSGGYGPIRLIVQPVEDQIHTFENGLADFVQVRPVSAALYEEIVKCVRVIYGGHSGGFHSQVAADESVSCVADTALLRGVLNDRISSGGAKTWDDGHIQKVWLRQELLKYALFDVGVVRVVGAGRMLLFCHGNAIHGVREREEVS